MPNLPIHTRLPDDVQVDFDNYMATHGITSSAAIRILIQLGLATELPDGFWLGFQEGVRQGRLAAMSKNIAASQLVAQELENTIVQEQENES